MNGCHGLVLACFAVALLRFTSGMTTRAMMKDSGNMKGPGKQQGSPGGDKMQGTMSSTSTTGGDDEDDAMESESMEADQMDDGENCTMHGMTDMMGKNNMANNGQRGGTTGAPAKAMMGNGKMGMRMTKANCTTPPMGRMTGKGGNDMMNGNGKMQSTTAMPRGRRN